MLACLRSYITEHGYPPSIRTLAALSGLASPATARYHLEQLQAKGYIRRAPGEPRAIQILDLDPLSAADQARVDQLTAEIRAWGASRPPVPVGEVITELMAVFRRKRAELTTRGLLPRTETEA